VLVVSIVLWHCSPVGFKRGSALQSKNQTRWLRQINEINLSQALRWYVWIHHLQSLALKLNHKAAVTLL